MGTTKFGFSFSSSSDPSADGAAAFTRQVARLHAALADDGIAFSDMRRADALELVLAGADEPGPPHERPPLPEIERLEGPIVPRRIVPAAPGASRLRYFLDGSQRTLPVCRVGVVPIVTVIASAAVLARDERGQPRVAPGSLRLRHAWLVPRSAPDPALRRLAARLDALGFPVEDPLDACQSADEYAAIAGDYGAVVEAAYRRARKVRERLESDLLHDWAAAPERAADDGWIVVDGRLRVTLPRALGLVKDLANQHLSGEEATALFGLPPGYRTSAFRARDRFRSVGLAARSPQDDEAPTLWYLRLWDASGLDARHALVRIEAAPAVRETAQIDALSSWLLAERIPRATADERWATLLYPIHYLERILKRRVDADTRGWPGAR